jgi:hypothetical protein
VAVRPINEDIVTLFDLIVGWFCIIFGIVKFKVRKLILEVVGLGSGRGAKTWFVQKEKDRPLWVRNYVELGYWHQRRRIVPSHEREKAQFSFPIPANSIIVEKMFKSSESMD